MRGSFCAAIALAGVLFWGPLIEARGEANFRSANFWQPLCESNDQGLQNTCLSYIAGFRDGLGMGQLFGAMAMICTPPEVTNGQLRQMLVKFMRDHPERLHEDLWVLLASVQAGAFPCPPGPSTTLEKGPKLSK